MENRIKTSGRLVYEPHRPGFNKGHKLQTLIIDLPKDDLDLYYQWFIEKNHRSYIRQTTFSTIKEHDDEHDSWMKPFIRRGEKVGLQRPMYGLHVTIVGGNERIKNRSAWKKHQGKIVEFEYAPVPRQHFQFWSLPVYGEHLQALRYELGLDREKDFHITIGRLYDWQPIHRSARRRAWEIRRDLEQRGIL